MLHHQNIIPFHGIVLDAVGNPMQLVTKLATGGSLLQYLSDRTLSLMETLNIAIDILGETLFQHVCLGGP